MDQVRIPRPTIILRLTNNLAVASSSCPAPLRIIAHHESVSQKDTMATLPCAPRPAPVMLEPN